MKLSAINRNLEGWIVPHNPAGQVSSPILDQIKNIRPLKIPIVRNIEVRFVPQNPVGKVCVKEGLKYAFERRGKTSASPILDQNKINLTFKNMELSYC